jgi:hypothetical protein
MSSYFKWTTLQRTPKQPAVTAADPIVVNLCIRLQRAQRHNNQRSARKVLRELVAYLSSPPTRREP